MILIIGGFAQGKLHYVEQHYVQREDRQEVPVLDGTGRQTAGPQVIVNHLHRYIREQLRQGTDPEAMIANFYKEYPDCILICDEIGNGIVPMEAEERTYRECTGRILEGGESRMRNRPENQIEIRLTLIRHGATLSNKEGRYLGKTDEALSPEGIGMLKKAVTGGNYPTADLLFSGPMKRCLETAQILYPGQTPIFVPEWTEMDFGAFEGHNYQELSGDPAYQRWIDSGGTLPFPEGESREEFIRRNVAGYEKMLCYMKMILERSAASEQGDYNTGSEKTELERSDEIGAQDAGIQSVSAVVHGGTIMALLSHFLGEQYFNYQVKCGQGYSGRLVFLGGTPEWKEFRPLSAFTKGETY